VPLVVLWPLIGAAREFAPGFWSRPAPDQLTDLYGQLFQPLALFLLAGAVLMTGTSLMDRVWQRPREMTPAPQDADHRDLPPDEMAAALMLLALPVAGYALAAAATGAFHRRYVLQVVLGLGILAAWWAARLVRSRREAAILLAVLLLGCGARLGTGVLSLGREPADPLASHTPIISMVPAGAPIVVSHALTFLQMVHYSGREAGTRLTYLTRPADVVEGLGVDTGGRALRRLAKVAPLEIREYDEFVGAHHQFHVYGPKSWLIPKLLSQSAQVRLLAEGEDGSLYAVEIRR
jgi:hypothetical protein